MPEWTQRRGTTGVGPAGHREPQPTPSTVASLSHPGRDVFNPERNEPVKRPRRRASKEEASLRDGRHLAKSVAKQDSSSAAHAVPLSLSSVVPFGSSSRSLAATTSRARRPSALAPLCSRSGPWTRTSTQRPRPRPFGSDGGPARGMPAAYRASRNTPHRVRRALDVVPQRTDALMGWSTHRRRAGGSAPARPSPGRRPAA
jgi:hypothetical protein